MKPTSFFFDRCCPPKLADVIRAFEDDVEVRHFNDDLRFVHNTPDIEWIGTLAKDPESAWVVLSMDGKILKRAHEKEAIRESGLPFFLLGSAWMSIEMHEKCWKLLKVWPNVVRTARESRHRIFEIMGGTGLKIDPK